MPPIRIQKLLSEAGVASRRAIEQMILDGRITVNGRLVAELPCFVDPDKDEIVVDGRAVRKRAVSKIYLLLNKPRGVVCTQQGTKAADERGRPSVVDVLPPMRERLHCIAPLDVDSTGLVLLTNDGELTQKLTRSGTPLERQYVIEVDGRIEEHALNSLKSGAYLDERRTGRARVKVLQRSVERSVIELDLVETVSREPRRVLARVGHKVRRLKRVGLGPLTDAGIKIGNFRKLAPRELRALEEIAAATPPPRRRRHTARRPRRSE
jgi:pseudouridine synthase